MERGSEAGPGCLSVTEMTDDPDVGRYSLKLDGDWDLQDLSVFRQYLHVYSVMYALQVGSSQDESRTRTFHAFEAFPWKGGWSTVDFYEGLRHATPDRAGPHRFDPILIAWVY